MKRYVASLGVAACALVAVAAFATAAEAQTPPAGQAPAAAPATPKMPDGHVDLSGIWGGGVAQLTPTICKKTIDAFANEGDARFTAGGAKGGKQWVTFEQDCGIQHRGKLNKPLYKPQYWERVRLSDYHANAGGQWIDYTDPQWLNYPTGVPRLGPPNKIVQTKDELVFLYQDQNQFRTIPTTCPEMDPVLKYDQTFNGVSVGCWNGDTMVITTAGFTDKSWLDWQGYFHSNEMVVTEKLTRNGNTLTWQATVDDPKMFLQPWTMDPVTLQVNTSTGAQLMQDVPYNDKSLGNLVDPEYRG